MARVLDWWSGQVSGVVLVVMIERLKQAEKTAWRSRLLKIFWDINRPLAA